MDMKDISVPGFKAGAVKAGIRGKDRLDVGLIVSEVPTTAAGVFTTSKVKAAPVLLDIEHLQGDGLQPFTAAEQIFQGRQGNLELVHIFLFPQAVFIQLFGSSLNSAILV